MKLSRIALVLAAATSVTAGAFAQDTSHESHHPADDQPQAAAPAVPLATTQPNANTMMGGSMMSMTTMMGMMGQGGMGNATMPGMDMADHVDGRIAFLKAELKITDGQDRVWKEFAQSLRTNAKTLGDMRAMMAKADAAGVPQRLEAQQKWYAARAEGIKALAASTTHLYGALADDQKKTADQILPPHVGLLPMMMPMGAMSMRALPAK